MNEPIDKMFSMLRTTLITLILAAAATHHAAAQPAVFVVRHAERADAAGGSAAMMAQDPELSAKGLNRAESLAAMLRDADIATIYTTELKRTQQTAAPLASTAGVRVTAIPAADVTALVEKVRGETSNVLIVGHSNTLPKILSALGVTARIDIAENDYDNLFIVLRGEPARVLRLRYE